MEKKKEETRALVKENPRAYLTHLAQQLGVSKMTTYRILREDIELFLYKVHDVQKLSVLNKAKRLQYFWLNGFANKQNMRLWSDENLHAIHEAQLHREKITVWAAISAHGIIGPVFLRETVNTENYRALFGKQYLS